MTNCGFAPSNHSQRSRQSSSRSQGNNRSSRQSRSSHPKRESRRRKGRREDGISRQDDGPEPVETLGVVGRVASAGPAVSADATNLVSPSFLPGAAFLGSDTTNGDSANLDGLFVNGEPNFSNGSATHSDQSRRILRAKRPPKRQSKRALRSSRLAQKKRNREIPAFSLFENSEVKYEQALSSAREALSSSHFRPNRGVENGDDENGHFGCILPKSDMDDVGHNTDSDDEFDGMPELEPNNGPDSSSNDSSEERAYVKREERAEQDSGCDTSEKEIESESESESESEESVSDPTINPFAAFLQAEEEASQDCSEDEDDVQNHFSNGSDSEDDAPNNNSDEDQSCSENGNANICTINTSSNNNRSRLRQSKSKKKRSKRKSRYNPRSSSRNATSINSIGISTLPLSLNNGGHECTRQMTHASRNAMSVVPFFSSTTNTSKRHANRKKSSTSNKDVDLPKSCAICFRTHDPNQTWKTLVTLPCCGTQGKEESSSTRFCSACILQVALSKKSSSGRNPILLFGDYEFGVSGGGGRAEDEYGFIESAWREFPVEVFYREKNQTEERHFIECPRCRDIIIVDIEKAGNGLDPDEDEEDKCLDGYTSDDFDNSRPRRAQSSSDWTNPTSAKSISILAPSFMEKCKFIGRKRGIARILWQIAFLHHSFIPSDALGGDTNESLTDSNVRKLVSWNILKTVPGKRNANIYEMDKMNQRQLIEYFMEEDQAPTEQQEWKVSELYSQLTFVLFCLSIRFVKRFHFVHSLRMVNRMCFLFLIIFGYLPPMPHSLGQELAVTMLNVFCIAVLLQFLVILAIYCGVFFGSILLVCFFLQRNNKRGNKISDTFIMAMELIVASFIVYKLGAYVYHSPYVTWTSFVPPKAIAPIKALIWN